MDPNRPIEFNLIISSDPKVLSPEDQIQGMIGILQQAQEEEFKNKKTLAESWLKNYASREIEGMNKMEEKNGRAPPLELKISYAYSPEGHNPAEHVFHHMAMSLNSTASLMLAQSHSITGNNYRNGPTLMLMPSDLLHECVVPGTKNPNWSNEHQIYFGQVPAGCSILTSGDHTQMEAVVSSLDRSKAETKNTVIMCTYEFFGSLHQRNSPLICIPWECVRCYCPDRWDTDKPDVRSAVRDTPKFSLEFVVKNTQNVPFMTQFFTNI